MALHLNLFHEIETQKALSRRDPLKLSMYGLGVVAAGMAGFYILQFAQASAATSQLRDAEQEYNKLKPQAEAGLKEEENLSASIKTSEALVKRIEGRFYWASVLQDLTLAVPKEVQLTKLAGDITSDNVRHGSITFDGIAAGEEPRKVAEDLRLTLIEKFAKRYKHVSAAFTLLDDGKDQVNLNGKAAPTAVFTIRLALQLLEDEAPPAPAKGSKRAAASGEAL